MVEAVVNLHIEDAQGMIDMHAARGPDYLFQKGMLEKIQAKHEPAAALKLTPYNRRVLGQVARRMFME